LRHCWQWTAKERPSNVAMIVGGECVGEAAAAELDEAEGCTYIRAACTKQPVSRGDAKDAARKRRAAYEGDLIRSCGLQVMRTGMCRDNRARALKYLLATIGDRRGLSGERAEKGTHSKYIPMSLMPTAVGVARTAVTAGTSDGHLQAPRPWTCLKGLREAKPKRSAKVRSRRRSSREK
jgi:hypothetical protein